MRDGNYLLLIEVIQVKVAVGLLGHLRVTTALVTCTRPQHSMRDKSHLVLLELLLVGVELVVDDDGHGDVPQ